MLKAIPKRWLSWDFAVEDAVGMPWGEVSLSFWRERGSVTAGGQQYRVSRQGFVGPFVLEGPDGELAHAVKVSPFKQEFTLSAERRDYVLRKLSWWSREFGLFSGDTQVGSLAPESWLSRRARVDLPEDMTGWLRAFVTWLTLLMWKRDSEAAAASAGS
jgi:hypothetical protein